MTTVFERTGHAGLAEAHHNAERFPARSELVRKYAAWLDSEAGQARILRNYLAAKLGVWTASGSDDVAVAADGLLLPVLAAANGISAALAYKIVEDLGGGGLATRARIIGEMRRAGVELLRRYPDLTLAKPEPGPPRDIAPSPLAEGEDFADSPDATAGSALLEAGLAGAAAAINRG